MGVLIAGAGPAGAATALLLARNGIEVRLVERERDFQRVFRGEGLTPSGVDALLEMKLGALLAAVPGRELESWHVLIDGEEIFRVEEPRQTLGERAFRVVSQPALLEGLVAEARRSTNFHFEPGTAVRDLLREQGRVVGARLHTSQGDRDVSTELVIGCDGRASLLRKRSGVELTLAPEHYDVLWFKLPAPERLWERCQMWVMVSGRQAGLCYTSWDGRLQWAWMLPKGTYREARDRNWVEELARSAPPWLSEHVRNVGDALEAPTLLDVIVGRCQSWSAAGVLLLGDAAHPMSPIRAQGINLALRDAVVAANHLVPVLRSGARPAALDAACAGIQAEREPEVVRAQTLQRRDSQGINTWAGPLLVALAKHVGRRVGRFGWAQRAWLAQQHDLRFGSTEVKLRVS